jgi:hypothetical protein
MDEIKLFKLCWRPSDAFGSTISLECNFFRFADCALTLLLQCEQRLLLQPMNTAKVRLPESGQIYE